MNDNKDLLKRYAGLSGQFLAGLAITVYGGIKLDEWLKLSIPLAVWALPLLFITGIIIRLIIDTGKKDNKK